MSLKGDFEKRGVSPVIATVLLIGMVIVIGLIVFLWIRELGGESISKNKKNAGLVCGDVEFDAEYSRNQISLSNTGNIPIFSFKVKAMYQGGYKTADMYEFDGWPDVGLGEGGAFRTNDASDHLPEETTKLLITPVLMGKSSKGERTYVCNPDSYGKEVII